MRRTACLLLLCAGSLPAQIPARRDAGWRVDLQLLAQELPRRHPAPFRWISVAQWDSAVRSLEQRLPHANRDDVLVGVLHLVALIGDAHTTVEPDSAFGERRYPLELYDFDDGLFVRRADSAHAGLVGARVLAIGRLGAADALTRVASIVSHENDWWVRAWGPMWLMNPTIVAGLGLAADREHVPLVVERGGRVDTIQLAPTSRVEAIHGASAEADAWVTMRQGPPPLWEQHPDRPFWWVLDSATRTVYVAMRAVVPAPQSNSNRAQWDQIFALIDSAAPARVVLDLRENLGGNGALNRYPIQQILRRPALDRPDRLFVVIGRRTFSAGQQFTNLLEWWTQATLVGEPSGQRPSQYGDHRPLVLPNLHVTVQISTVFHQAPNEFDDRAFVPPAVYAPLTSASYRLGIDPAWQAIIAPDTTAPVATRVDQLLASGDSSDAEQSLRAAQGAVANRFRSFERDINALGYQLLAGGQGERAVAVFRLNTRVYPTSANTFDSLGEALLSTGKREEAVAAYRRALEIDPGFPPSRQALQRLGVTQP
jgi:hypothetical protein